MRNIRQRIDIGSVRTVLARGTSVSQLNDVPERDLAEALNGTSDHRLLRSRNGCF